MITSLSNGDNFIDYRFAATWECAIARGTERRGMLTLRGHWGLRPPREMTMTSVAVAPGSLGAPPAMLTPKMYHLQQGLSPTSGSPISGKVSRPPCSAPERDLPPMSDLRSRAVRCARERVWDARRSYGGVLRNGTEPRLESWNLIRGWSLDIAIVASCGGFLRRYLLLVSHFSSQSNCYLRGTVWTVSLPSRPRANESPRDFRSPPPPPGAFCAGQKNAFT